MNNKLTYKELEALTSDYVLGRLDNEQVILFEKSMLDFPEIMEEVNSIRKTFELFDKYDLKSNIKANSKNFSVEIQDKLNAKYVKTNVMSAYSKFVYPAAGIIALAYFYFFTNIFDGNSSNSQYEFTIFQSQDLDSLSNKSDILDKLTIEGYNLESSLIEDYSLIDLNIIDKNDYRFYGNENFIYQKYQLNEMISNLNEDEFINILEELKNENFDV